MSFTQRLKNNSEVFDTVVKLLDTVATQNNLEFATLWSQVSSRDVVYFKKYHRKESKRNDPLAQIKRHRTAFSFFTQDRRNAIAQQNKNLSFGQVSRLVGEQWRGLDDKTRSKYKTLEVVDRDRYNKAREEIMKDLASKQAEVASAVVTPVETVPVETVAAETTASPVKAKSRKAKQTTRGKATSVETTPVETIPVETVAAETTSSPDKTKSRKGKPAHSNK